MNASYSLAETPEQLMSHLVSVAEPPHPESDFDEMFKCDRLYFRSNPHKKQYIREPFAEEISEFGQCEKIIVTNFGGGFRTRQPFHPKKKQSFWKL
jgi:hypothetical protein